MLPKQIVSILNFFDIFGYYTASSAIAKYQKMQLLVFIVQILLATNFALYQFQFVIEFGRMLGPLEIANEMFQYAMGLCTYWAIIFDTFKYRRKHQQFWKILKRIDTDFCKQFLSFRGYLCKLIEFFLVSITVYILSYIYRAFPQTNGVFISLALIIICRIRMFYYVFCLEIINWQLQMVQHELIVIKQWSSNTNHSASNSILRTHVQLDYFNLSRFKWVNQYYGCIVEMTELLNIIFSWSQFAVILYGFYSLLTDLNWCYVSFDLFPSLKYFRKYIFNDKFL